MGDRPVAVGEAMAGHLILLRPTVATVTGPAAVVFVGAISALAGTVAMGPIVTAVPAAEPAGPAVGVGRVCTAVGHHGGGQGDVPVVAGTQRKSGGTLEVHDYGRADVDPVRREGPYLVRVIGGSIVVGGFAEGTCQEGAVGMGDSAQIGVDGETARGEHQFGDLWAQESHRADATVAGSGADPAGGREVGVGGARVVYESAYTLNE